MNNPIDKNALFQLLVEQARQLTPENITEVETILAKGHQLRPLQRKKLMDVIKKSTGLTLESQRQYLKEEVIEEKPDQLDLARKIIDGLGQENIIVSGPCAWKWDKTGVWQSLLDRELKQLAQNGLKDAGEQIQNSLVSGVTEVLLNDLYNAHHEWHRENVINVKNGELSWNGSTWILGPHVREHYLTTQIPVEYNENAECPRFRQFLKEVFGQDADGKDKAKALLEMLGYTLTTSTEHERFVMLIGSGANGKSVFLDIVVSLLGKDNVSAVNPSQFSNKFQRAHMFMKLANIVTEISEGAEIADAELKAIVSGELMTAEHKGKDPFEFNPFATCWFGTNHMPHTRDFSDALFRRALVIPFNRTFKVGVDADPQLKEKLKTELPGIMFCALYYYGEALKRGQFTEPASCLEAKEQWRLEADQVSQFIDEKCALETNAEITSKALYQEYRDWADDAGIIKKLNHKNFTSRILRHGCKKDRGTAGVRMIFGIRIGWKADINNPNDMSDATM